MRARSRRCGERHLIGRNFWLHVAGAVAVAAMTTSAVAQDMDDTAAGEEAAFAVCASACHGWEAIFDGPRQLPGQWDYVVSDMVGRGAVASEQDLKEIRHFLKRTWGMVWINNASASDLVEVLALPPDSADAVIAWRDAHGKFTDLDSLKAVPGIDTASLDAQADAIMFN